MANGAAPVRPVQKLALGRGRGRSGTGCDAEARWPCVTDRGRQPPARAAVDGRKSGPTGRLLHVSLLAPELGFRDSRIRAGSLDGVPTPEPREDRQTGRRKPTEASTGDGAHAAWLCYQRRRRGREAPHVRQAHPAPRRTGNAPPSPRESEPGLNPVSGQKSLRFLTKNPLTARGAEAQLALYPPPAGQCEDDSPLRRLLRTETVLLAGTD